MLNTLLMTTPVSELSVLLATMEPALHDGVYVYSSVTLGSDISQLPVIATVREAEGLTVVVAEDVAVSAGLPVCSAARGSRSRCTQTFRPWG